MKSVMNSKRSPFQVKRYGHDDGLRSSSVSASVACGTTPAAGASAAGGSSACTMPAGHSTRTTSAPTSGRRGRRRCRSAPPAGHALDGLELLPQAARAQLDLRAHRAAVADLARQADPERRLPAAAVVLQHDQPPALGTGRRAQHQVGVPVAVEVAGRHPRRARHRGERLHRPHRRRARPAGRCCRRCAPAPARRPWRPRCRAGRRCRDRRTAPRSRRRGRRSAPP